MYFVRAKQSIPWMFIINFSDVDFSWYGMRVCVRAQFPLVQDLQTVHSKRSRNRAIASITNRVNWMPSTAEMTSLLADGLMFHRIANMCLTSAVCRKLHFYSRCVCFSVFELKNSFMGSAAKMQAVLRLLRWQDRQHLLTYIAYIFFWFRPVLSKLQADCRVTRRPT